MLNIAATATDNAASETAASTLSNIFTVTFIDYLSDLFGSCLFNIAACRLQRPKDKVPSLFFHAPNVRGTPGNFSQRLNKNLENSNIEYHEKLRFFLNILSSTSLENLISMSALQICDFGLLHFGCICCRFRKALILERQRDYNGAVTLLIETKELLASSSTEKPSRLDLDLFCDINKCLFFSQRFIMNCKLPCLLGNDVRSSIDNHDFSLDFTPSMISYRVSAVDNFIDSKINRLYYLRDCYG